MSSFKKKIVIQKDVVIQKEIVIPAKAGIHGGVCGFPPARE
jgi:hypothetical protein